MQIDQCEIIHDSFIKGDYARPRASDFQHLPAVIFIRFTAAFAKYTFLIEKVYFCVKPRGASDLTLLRKQGA